MQQKALAIQLNQLADAALILAGFVSAGRLLELMGSDLGHPPSWLLYLVVPFTPLLLEAAGFYREPARWFRLALVLAGVSLVANLLLWSVARAGWLSPGLEVGLGFSFVLILARDAFVARWESLKKPHGIP